MTDPLSDPAISLTREAAHQTLKRFDCLNPATVLTEEERSQLRQSLLVVADESEYQMLGICAETAAEGCQALETYARALGYTADPPEAIAGSVYIKFNPISGKCYISDYPGEHRGVLVSCQSSEADGINEMYGHLPLNLFVD
ncbi:MAG: DUF1824 family protein [Oculatellaceae cyanobacterium Prado106]|nr:DUF1824 family protein [Oculatellaceae cyanobacterium Prado106]